MKYRNFLFLCVILVLSLSGCGNKQILDNKLTSDSEVLSTNEEIKSQAESEPISITLSFAGDVTLGNYHGSSYVSTFNHEFDTKDGNYSYFFENVSEIFKNDDLTIVNLEGPLTDATVPAQKKFAFKGNPSYVNILTSGSVEAVTLANNHSLDYFEDGFNDTKDTLRENNISYFGLGEKDIIDVKGIKVGLLGYKGWPEYYTEENLESMKTDLADMKKNADMTVVYFHWGNEQHYYPEQSQIDFAHFSIDNGADVVIGSHPHVVQGIEKYKDKYIAYSMGNFAFGGNKNPKDKDTFVYQQKFTFKDCELIDISNPNAIPCSISSTPSRNDYKPTIVKGEEGNRILDKLKKLSLPLNK